MIVNSRSINSRIKIHLISLKGLILFRLPYTYQEAIKNQLRVKQWATNDKVNAMMQSQYILATILRQTDDARNVSSPD